MDGAFFCGSSKTSETSGWFFASLTLEWEGWEKKLELRGARGQQRQRERSEEARKEGTSHRHFPSSFLADHFGKRASSALDHWSFETSTLSSVENIILTTKLLNAATALSKVRRILVPLASSKLQKPWCRPSSLRRCPLQNHRFTIIESLIAKENRHHLSLKKDYYIPIHQSLSKSSKWLSQELLCPFVAFSFSSPSSSSASPHTVRLLLPLSLSYPLNIINILSITQALLITFFTKPANNLPIVESITINDGEFYFSFQPSQLNFMLFNAVWTLLIVAFILVATMRFTALAHPLLILGLDALTMLFWFAGFIALAVIVKDFSFLLSDTSYHTAQATAAFGAFEW